MKVNNKTMIQSYLVTAARYDFDVYEKRILYRLVEICQCALTGQKLNKGFQVNHLLFDELKEIEMPISAFLKDEKDENYAQVKKALLALKSKVMLYEDEEVWKPISIIEMPKLFKRGFVRFVLQKEIYEALLNFSAGFRKIELKTAMEFNTVYAMRFYELLSEKKEPITYKIEDLKIMFQLENKYARYTDFIKRVVVPAQKELEEKAPFSFTFKPNPLHKSTKKIGSLTFKTYLVPSNADQELERKEIQKNTSLRWDLDNMVTNYLKENYLFSTPEIKNNIELFKSASVNLDIMNFMAKKKRLASEKKNPKGYLINALKSELKKKPKAADNPPQEDPEPEPYTEELTEEEKLIEPDAIAAAQKFKESN